MSDFNTSKQQIGRFCHDNSVKWLANYDLTAPSDESLWVWTKLRAEALVMTPEEATRMYGHTNYPVSTFTIDIDEELK